MKPYAILKVKRAVVESVNCGVGYQFLGVL